MPGIEAPTPRCVQSMLSSAALWHVTIKYSVFSYMFIDCLCVTRVRLGLLCK